MTPSVSVIRGNCFDITAQWADSSIGLVITDPPYGGILANGWDKQNVYPRLGVLLDRLLAPGGTAYVWGGVGTPRNRIFFDWLARVESETSLTIHNLITWGKKRAYGTATNYLFTREECAMLTKGKPSVFNIPLLDEERGYAGYNPKYPAKSKFKRRTNVWSDVTELFRGKIHPAEKPSRLAEIMLLASSEPGDTVCDFFAGSGSTGVAALRNGRSAILIEESTCAMHTFSADCVIES